MHLSVFKVANLHFLAHYYILKPIYNKSVSVMRQDEAVRLNVKIYDDLLKRNTAELMKVESDLDVLYMFREDQIQS